MARSHDDTDDMAGRIRWRIRELGLSQTAIADRFGIRPQAVSQWASGSTKPEAAKLDLLARLLGCSVTYLLTGEEVQEDEDWERAYKNGEPAGKPIPIVNYITAGQWRSSASDSDYGDDDNAWPIWLETDQPASSEAFALEVRGDSMLPTFVPGDRVIVDPAVEPRPGDVVVASIEGDTEAVLRKYRVVGFDSERKPIFDLVPLNEDYPVLQINERQPGRIVGTMIEHRRYRRV